MRLNHNLDSLNAYREYSRNVRLNSTALSHIVTGEKVEKASDEPNKVAKSERMRLEIRGLQMAQRNVQDGASLMQSADGTLSCANSILNRIRELVIQYGSGANAMDDKAQIKNEINEMINGYSDIINNAEFNKVRLFFPKGKDFKEEKTMQIGNKAGENMNINFFDLTIENVGVKETDLNENVNIKNKMSLKDLQNDDLLKDPNFVDKALSIVDGASQQIIHVRSEYGAISNKFDGLINNLNEFEITTQKSESSIRDADIAEEMAEFVKTNILIEASGAIMVQTNKFPQDMLRILENIRK